MYEIMNHENYDIKENEQILENYDIIEFLSSYGIYDLKNAIQSFSQIIF